MRKISFWAKHHKWAARFTIIASFILLNSLGIFIGILLNALKIWIPTTMLITTVGIYLSAFILYPHKQQREKRNSSAFYVRQKTFDFILASSAFFMVVYIGNQPEILIRNNQIAFATTPGHGSLPNDSTTRTYKSIPSFSASMKNENGKSLKWREKKKLLKVQINGIKKANDLSDGEKVVLIILSCIVAFGLLLLVASAACSLSCNGADGAALLVGVGGLALVIFLLVIVIRAINGKKKKQKTMKPIVEG